MAFTPAPAPAADRGYDQSAVPSALKNKAARSEKAIELMRAGKDPRDPANWQEPQAANPAPQQTQERQQSQPPTNPPPTPAPAAEAPSEQPQRAPAEDQTWEQRYRSLEGQFRNQQRAIQGYEGEINQLRGVVQRLEQGGAPQGGQQELPAGQKSHVDITKIFSEEELQDWGPEWAKSMQRIADAVAAPMQARIDQLEGTTTTIARNEMRSARQMMLDGLGSAKIDIDELNLSPDWIDWINNVDVGAGKLRRDLIQEAWDRNEGSRVEYFARQFLREVRNAEPEAQPPKPKPDGRAPAPRGTKGLEDIAAPGKARGTEPPRPADDGGQPETFTAKQYADFYRDKSLGRLKMTPEDVASWEKRLNDAYRGGRITQTPTE